MASKALPIAALLAVLASSVCAEAAARSDSWITAKTKIALLVAPDVGGLAVNVDTARGEVTLHGTVGSRREREQAGRIALGVEGVSSVRNLLAVVPSVDRAVVKASDGEVRARVEAALRSAIPLQTSEIRVASVNDGVVLLAGRVDSLSTHLRALEVARAVDGVRRVASEIESPDTLADARIREQEQAEAGSAAALLAAASDAWTTAQVKALLLASEAPATVINVDTTDGVVTLFGIVPTEQTRSAAEIAALRSRRVRRVENALQVVPASQQSAIAQLDALIERGVLDRFAQRSELADADIEVEVKNGVVRLTGHLAKAAERVTAVTLTSAAPGVKSVIDDLELDQRSDVVRG